MSPLLVWVFLCIVSFLPPLFYVIWIRNTEHCHRQSWGSILLCFLWGASIAVIAALILELILGVSLSLTLQNENTLSFVTVIFLAPVVEEFTKPFALRLRSVRRGISELEDGLIYGAVAGLGFSATENLFYGRGFLSEGFFVFVVLMILRSIGGCLLHASATALTGYGYGKTLLLHTSFLRIIPYFVLAIGVHSLYNFFVTFEFFGSVTFGTATGVFLAFFFVLFTISLIRKKIISLDKQNC
ncbi:MAG: PrsW family intramembrane metalloprotease [Methanobacteriota archaeon]